MSVALDELADVSSILSDSLDEDLDMSRIDEVEKRIDEIRSGAYDELIEAIMQKPLTELQELYNHRDIEK